MNLKWIALIAAVGVIFLVISFSWQRPSRIEGENDLVSQIIHPKIVKKYDALLGVELSGDELAELNDEEFLAHCVEVAQLSHKDFLTVAIPVIAHLMEKRWEHVAEIIEIFSTSEDNFEYFSGIFAAQAAVSRTPKELFELYNSLEDEDLFVTTGANALGREIGKSGSTGDFEQFEFLVETFKSANLSEALTGAIYVGISESEPEFAATMLLQFADERSMGQAFDLTIDNFATQEPAKASSFFAEELVRGSSRLSRYGKSFGAILSRRTPHEMADLIESSEIETKVKDQISVIFVESLSSPNFPENEALSIARNITNPVKRKEALEMVKFQYDTLRKQRRKSKGNL